MAKPRLKMDSVDSILSLAEPVATRAPKPQEIRVPSSTVVGEEPALGALAGTVAGAAASPVPPQPPERVADAPLGETTEIPSAEGRSEKPPRPTRPGKRRLEGGPPTKHEMGSSKATIVLTDTEIDALQLLQGRLKRHSGVLHSRSAIIRAAVLALVDSRIDLRNIFAEQQLRHELAAVLRRGAATERPGDGSSEAPALGLPSS